MRGLKGSLPHLTSHRLPRVLVQAKEAKPDITPEQLSFDNRVRQFSTPDQIFNYFSSIQLVNKFGTV